jgi:hypothetical protein
MTRVTRAQLLPTNAHINTENQDTIEIQYARFRSGDCLKNMDQEFWSERNRIYVVRMVQAIAAIIPKSMAFPRQAGMERRPVANQNMRERTSIKQES